MERAIVFPNATVLDKDGVLYEGIRELIESLHSEGDEIIFLSHNRKNEDKLKSEFEFAHYILRTEIRNVVKGNEDFLFIIIGGSEKDMHLASNIKGLLINPPWSYIQDERAWKYSLHVAKNPQSLGTVLSVLKNQKHWYYRLAFENIEVYSLISAKYKVSGITPNEKELIIHFEDTLKRGIEKHKNIILLHFLSSIIKNREFNKVNIWAIMPSSSIEFNPIMVEIKERARITMSNRQSEPLFIRHKSISKSRGLSDEMRLPCDRHFDSIYINPHYEGKLKNKTICVIDDYLTNGTSFETLRNMLKHEGVKKVIFVSIGKFTKFDRDYVKQDYKLSGDLYTPKYKYKLINRNLLNGNFNDKAREELLKLYNIKI